MSAASKVKARFLRSRPLYKVWNSMIQRCENPKNHNYHNYGGRGIKVCERWRLNYRAFEHDVGPRPKGASIDRINNNGNYEPSNCRWATRKEQNANCRRAKLFTADGRTMHISDWGRLLGITSHSMRYRIRRYGIEHAVRMGAAHNPFRATKNNCGYRGVCRVPNGYRAGTQVRGRFTYIGVFQTPEEARVAYLAARKAIDERGITCRKALRAIAHNALKNTAEEERKARAERWFTPIGSEG